MQVMLFNPKRKTTERVLETSEPLDTLDSIPPSDLKKKIEPGTYIYYPSEGRIIRENKNNPTDKVVFDLPDGRSPIVDPEKDDMYYIIFDQNIVKESPVGSNNREYLIRESGKLNSLSHDPKRNILVFANSDAGTIEAYNINTKGRFVFYRGLDSPKKLTYDPEKMYVCFFLHFFTMIHIDD